MTSQLHANFFLIKVSDSWLRLSILIFGTSFLLRADIVLNSIRDPTYILHNCLDNFGHIHKF